MCMDVYRSQENNQKTKVINGRITRLIKNLFEEEEEEKGYYKPVREDNLWSNNYVEYESNGDRNKTLSIKDTLMKLSHTGMILK